MLQSTSQTKTLKIDSNQATKKMKPKNKKTHPEPQGPH